MNNTDDEITINQNCLAAPEFTKSCASTATRDNIAGSQQKGNLGDTKKEGRTHRNQVRYHKYADQ